MSLVEELCVLPKLTVWSQCRINHVADVANATGLRLRGASGIEKIFSARQYSSNLTTSATTKIEMGRIDIGTK